MAISGLTLQERQALRRGEKIYRDGQEIDKDGYPVHQEEPYDYDSPGDDGQYLPPGVTAVPSFQQTIKEHKEDQYTTAIQDREKTLQREGAYGGVGSDSGSGSGGYGKKRVAEDSRGQHNLTGKRRSSILTERV